MKKIIAGNWKMNTTKAEATALATDLASKIANVSTNAQMILCPPHAWLSLVNDKISGSAVSLGGQDCHTAEKGAYTGNVSAPMLKDVGCQYVIVGHSERRQYCKETNEIVKAKAEAALKNGLTPIICVGETEEERTSGQHETSVGKQLAESLPDDANVIVAYEPVWAIGTGKTATNEDVAAMHAFIRAQVSQQVKGGQTIPLLYGGSVKGANAKDILAIQDVNGVLVGGASLQADEFLSIAQAA